MTLDLIFGAQTLARPLVPPGVCKSLLAAACLVSVFPVPGAAQALSESGPTASASINITVSVAKRYSLAASGGASKPQGLKQAEFGQFCISTNGGETLLPVMLMWPTPDQANDSELPQSERAMQLPPCGTSGHALIAADAPGQARGIRAVIIRPE